MKSASPTLLLVGPYLQDLFMPGMALSMVLNVCLPNACISVSLFTRCKNEPLAIRPGRCLFARWRYGIWLRSVEGDVVAFMYQVTGALALFAIQLLVTFISCPLPFRVVFSAVFFH